MAFPNRWRNSTWKVADKPGFKVPAGLTQLLGFIALNTAVDELACTLVLVRTEGLEVRGLGADRTGFLAMVLDSGLGTGRGAGFGVGFAVALLVGLGAGFGDTV